MSVSRKYPEKLSALLNKSLPKDLFWIEPSILPKRGTMLFGGAAKIGKSYIMLELARALATATRPFDSDLFTVPQKAKVLVIEQELGEYELQKRSEITVQNHIPLTYEETFYYLSIAPDMQLNQHEGFKYLYECVEKVEPNVVFLDPISMFHGFDENSNSEIGELFRRIEKIKEAFRHKDLAFVLSHHFRKPASSTYGKPSDPLSPYNFSGSQRWFNTPDTLATFTRGKTLADKSGWFVDSRWIPRKGKQPDDITFLVKPEDPERQVRIHHGGGDRDGGDDRPLPIVKRFTKAKNEDV